MSYKAEWTSSQANWQANSLAPATGSMVVRLAQSQFDVRMAYIQRCRAEHRRQQSAGTLESDCHSSLSPVASALLLRDHASSPHRRHRARFELCDSQLFALQRRAIG